MTQRDDLLTLRSAAGLANKPTRLEDSTLLIIDAQQEYAAGGQLPLDGMDAAVQRIAELADAARGAGSPVIHIVHQGRAGGLFSPGAGGQIVDALTPHDGDHVVTKTLPNAFAGTDLLERLEFLGERALILTGFMTHMCISSTARAALDLNIGTTVVSDATASRSLPSIKGPGSIPMPAATVHEGALAALADRFSIITESAVLTQSVASA